MMKKVFTGLLWFPTVITLLVIPLIACTQNDINAQQNKIKKNTNNAVNKVIKKMVSENAFFINLKQSNNIKSVIALNTMICLLSQMGEVGCITEKTQSDARFSDLQSVSFSDLKVTQIFGQADESHQFSSGDVGCAYLSDQSVSCWNVNDDNMFDAEKIFHFSKASKSKNKITSLPVRAEILKQFGDIEKLITTHNVLCAIDKKGQLFCPHDHLKTVSVNETIKNAVMGEYLSCLHLTSNMVECFDMRENTQPEPITFSFNGDVEPTKLAMRVIHQWETCIIGKKRNLSCWNGNIDNHLKYSYIHHIPVKEIAFETSVGVKDVKLVDTHSCALLDNGNAYCWGRNTEGQLGEMTNEKVQSYLSAPGRKMSLNHITSIFIGSGYSCFLTHEQFSCLGKILTK